MSPITWVRQVRHVALKDLRNARWSLLAFVAATIVATFFGIARVEAPSPEAALTGFLALVSGLALAAVLLQADPPAGRRAFWAGTPLLPSAVLGAKLFLSFGVILGVRVLAELFVAASYRAPTGDIRELVWQTAVAYGAWVLAVLVFAAVFRTFTSVVFATILTFVAGPFVVLIAARPLPESVSVSVLTVATSARSGLYLLILAAGLFLLSYLYRTHDERRRWRIAGVALAAGSTVLVHVPPPPVVPSEAASLPYRSELDGFVPGIQDIQYVYGEDGPLRIRLTAPGGDAAVRYRIVPESARLVRADGSVAEVPIELFIDSGDGGPPGSAAGRWLGEQWAGPASTEIRLQLEASDWELVRLGQSDIEVTSRVELLEPRRVVALPVEVGANAAGRGTWIEISGIGERADAFFLRLATRTLRARAENTPVRELGERGPAYALIHEERGEGIALMPTGGEDSYGPDPIGISMPGSGIRRSSFALGPLDPKEAPPAQEWLREARLHVFDWVPAGARQLTVRNRLRPVPRRPQ